NANGSPLATFDFTVNDTGTGVVTAQMDIDVTAVNNAPATIGIVDVTVNEDSTATSIDLNAAFDDPDNLDSELTYSITGNTNIGLFSSAAVNAATGELVLNYAADMNGSSQISMRATDPAGAFVDTLFTVTVTPVNDAPILVANTGATAVGTNPTVISSAQLNTNDVDNTNTEIVYTVTTLPTNGELLVNGVAVTSFTQDDLDNNRVSYQANGASVSDQFGFTVSDGAGGTILGNSFNILVQLAPTEPTDPVEPEVPTEPEEPDPGTTPTEPVVEVTPVNPEEPTDDYGSGFTPIGNNNPAETEPERIPEENFDEFENIDVPQVNNELTEYKIDSNTEYREIQVKSIKALFTAMDQMKDQMDEKVKENMASVEFTAAAVSSSGVALTAGAVAWVLRSGALMTSLMAVMPVWRGYDPLPILNYRENEDDENLTEDKIPTSLEELIKIKALKDKMNKENQLDSLFGTSAEGREGTNV
ncbi:MAG: cadherin-like domain-containing protein, partial [Gammaproteobacteria bacterium]